MAAVTTTGQVANLALAFLKNSQRIVNLDTDDSEQAVAIRLVFDTVLRRVLRAVPMPWSRGYMTLAETGDDPPTDEWDFAYTYPSGIVALRRIQSSVRRDTKDTRISYLVAANADADGQIILTDEPQAKVEVTVEVGVDIYGQDDLFVKALYLALAAEVAPVLAGNDKKGRGALALRMYEQAINEAAAAAQSEEQQDEDSDSEFIRCR